jgi:trehalose 6-phosphate phosphatase
MIGPPPNHASASLGSVTRRAYLEHVLSQQPCALCMDIDGTISATAPTVEAAMLLPGVRELLIEATHAFDLVATVSGRAIEDQRRMIGVIGVWHVGHHGYEWEELDSASGERRVVLLPETAPYLQEIEQALDEIEAELTPLVPGLWMERKGITGGIHWRRALDHGTAEGISVPVIERIAHTHGLRCHASKLAVEIFPPIITDKGEGLRRLVKMHQLRGMIYMGDDVSDTDAFLMLRERRAQGEGDGIAVGVLHLNSPEIVGDSSDILVRDTADIPGLLHWMLTTRMNPVTNRKKTADS